MEYQTGFRGDLIDPSVYLAAGAVVLGDVSIGSESSVWFNAVLRGETEAVRVGRQTIAFRRE